MELRKLNSKRGQMSLDLVGKILVAALVLTVTAIAIFLAMDALQGSNLFTANSASDNATDNIIGNVTDGTESFFENIPTILTILGVVAIMTGIAILIVVVKRSGQGGGL